MLCSRWWCPVAHGHRESTYFTWLAYGATRADIWFQDKVVHSGLIYHFFTGKPSETIYFSGVFYSEPRESTKIQRVIPLGRTISAVPPLSRRWWPHGGFYRGCGSTIRESDFETASILLLYHLAGVSDRCRLLVNLSCQTWTHQYRTIIHCHYRWISTINHHSPSTNLTIDTHWPSFPFPSIIISYH